MQISSVNNFALALIAAAHCTVDQTQVTAGGSATGTMKLAIAAGTGGTMVSLLSDDPAVHVPTSVTVPEGATAATFPVFTDSFAGSVRMVHIQTSYNGTATVPFTLKVNPQAVNLALSQIAFVGGSTSHPTLTLNLSDAQATDLTFGLASSDPLVTVPASVTIPAGQKSLRVNIGHTLRPTAKTVVLSATSNGTTVASASLTLRPFTATLTFIPNTVEGGKAATGVLQLNANVAATLSIALSVSDPALGSVPASVAVNAGDKAAVFNVATALADRTKTLTVTASVNGNPFAGRLTIVPGATLSALTIPTYGYGHQTVTGTVRFREPAPAGGATVSLSAASPASVPASVTVAEGQTDATFPITLDDVSTETAGSVTATGGAVTLTKPVSARPLALSSVSLSTATVVGGNPVTGTVTLNAAVAVDTVVNLSSDNPASASVPATVTVPAGSNSAAFTITTTHAATAKNVKITASKNASSLYKTLKVTP